jgi:hypothetical protein
VVRRAGPATALLLAAALAAPVPASAGGPAKERPFKVSFDATASIDFAPNFPRGGPSTFGGRCSVPSHWVLSWSGSGNASHAGAVTVSGSDCERVTGNGGEVAVGDGRVELAAANGDTVRGTYDGHGDFMTGRYSLEWTFTGGTGRFAGATGHVSSSSVLTSTSIVGSGSGTIGY